jgi:hypothetical protein
MTTILYHKGKLFADSSVYKGSERLQALNKINVLEMPLPIKCEQDSYQFDDVVYGWSGTGNYPAMLQFVKSLEDSHREHGISRLTMAFYAMAGAAELCLQGNVFEVFMIGKAANHSFRFDMDGFNYAKYDQEQIVGLGSGCHDVVRNVKHHDDPVRAMLETFVTDTTSGGFIDCWGLREEEGITYFRRFGLHDEIPHDLIRHVLEKHAADGVREIPLRFVRNTVNSGFNKGLMDENAALLKQVERLKKANAKLRGVPVKKVGVKKGLKA